MVWSVQRGSGWFYSVGTVHDGRGSRRHPWRARGDLLLDSAAEVQGIVATWCLPGSGRVLEALARALRVEVQGRALIWVGLAGLDTAEQRGQGRHRGTGENSSVLLLGAEIAGDGGVDEREQGGPGRPGNGEERHGALRRGEGVR